ncbi:FadR/GntR family transcriptional regulator [Nonomuraea ferruginea]
MAAELMTDDDIDELRVILESLPEEPTIEELVANDLRFHQRIALGSGNSVLCSFIESLSGPTTRARIWRGLTQEGALAKTREQHTAIYEAIAARQGRWPVPGPPSTWRASNPGSARPSTNAVRGGRPSAGRAPGSRGPQGLRRGRPRPRPGGVITRRCPQSVYRVSTMAEKL